jgi:hypothetical protein
MMKNEILKRYTLKKQDLMEMLFDELINSGHLNNNTTQNIKNGKYT